MHCPQALTFKYINMDHPKPDVRNESWKDYFGAKAYFEALKDGRVTGGFIPFVYAKWKLMKIKMHALTHDFIKESLDVKRAKFISLPRKLPTFLSYALGFCSLVAAFMLVPMAVGAPWFVAAAWWLHINESSKSKIKFFAAIVTKFQKIKLGWFSLTSESGGKWRHPFANLYVMFVCKVVQYASYLFAFLFLELDEMLGVYKEAFIIPQMDLGGANIEETLEQDGE